MKKKIKIALISFFSLIFAAIFVFILVLWLYPKHGEGGKVIVTAHGLSTKPTIEEKSFIKKDIKNIEVTYSNVYGYLDNFVFKDEGYIIIDKNSCFGMIFQYNENVTVYELELENDRFIEKEILLSSKLCGLAEYDVAHIRYVKIVFDSDVDTDEFCAGNIGFIW